ncbi:MAG: HAD-IA family hydrolase [Candidatus Magasanikbacteria bacterium]|nr:HAD-IA family hydrolase [Candidatus Magasanikbacteria bacterium]
MKSNKVIIFDFDGVIADSLAIAFEVNQLSRPTLTLERYKAGFDGNINDVKYEDKVVREVDFFKEFGDRFATLSIDPEKKKIIQTLATEFKLFIISSTNGDIIRKYLQKLDCFTDILGNEVQSSKVKKFNMLFNKYNIKPTDIIFITDSSGDMKEAKEANIQTIVGILGGYQNEESLKKGNPTAIVENFSQFYDFVHFYK